MSLIMQHYGRAEVRKEISEFVKGRWVALEGSLEGKRLFIRYRGRRPLTIKSEAEVYSLLMRYRGVGVRTIYATLNKYSDLSTTEALDDPANIESTTPFWDIDTTLDKWDYAIRAAEEIVTLLEKEGVSKSVYVLWSGEGAHVRINENAFSSDILSKHHPLDVAFAVVEYVIRRLKDRFEELHESSGGVLKVENLVDIKRVFTAPLSLHRSRDLVAVCVDPDKLLSFDLSWAEPGSFRHSPSWRNYEEGEADALALKAIAEVGKGRVFTSRVKAARVGVTPGRRREVVKEGIGRFEVMALLQAARYFLLTGDLEKAKSFGLNRAIFYAWAKHYGRTYAARKLPRRYWFGGSEVREEERELVKAAGEEAFVSPRGWFVMGDKEQLPEDYDRNVVRKIERVVPYDIAWEAALKYLSKFPKHVLTNQQRFYEKVYKPVRDVFLERVVEEPEPAELSPPAARPKPKVKEKKEEPKRSGRKSLLDWVKKSGDS